MLISPGPEDSTPRKKANQDNPFNSSNNSQAEGRSFVVGFKPE
jgi:hypothetical protein